MSRAERVVKKLAKRHHLHLTYNLNDELLLTPHSLLVDSQSRELISARGIVENAEVSISVRSSSKVVVDPIQNVGLVSVVLPFGLELMALGKTTHTQLMPIVRQLHTDWSEHNVGSHQLSLSIAASDEQLQTTAHALSHVPPELSVEVIDQCLTFFSIPALTDENELESTLRLAIATKRLFVTT